MEKKLEKGVSFRVLPKTNLFSVPTSLYGEAIPSFNNLATNIRRPNLSDLTLSGWDQLVDFFFYLNDWTILDKDSKKQEHSKFTPWRSFTNEIDALYWGTVLIPDPMSSYSRFCTRSSTHPAINLLYIIFRFNFLFSHLVLLIKNKVCRQKYFVDFYRCTMYHIIHARKQYHFYMRSFRTKEPSMQWHFEYFLSLQSRVFSNISNYSLRALLMCGAICVQFWLIMGPFVFWNLCSSSLLELYFMTLLSLLICIFIFYMWVTLLIAYLICCRKNASKPSTWILGQLSSENASKPS